jgi:signal transduction histidine kinase
VISLAYAVVSVSVRLSEMRRPALAVTVLVGMAAWTVAVTLLLRRTRAPWVLALDLAVAAAALLSGLAIQERALIDAGTPTLTLSWGAVPVLAWAVAGGPVGGLAAALGVSAATLVWRQDVSQATVGSIVLLLLAGLVVGFVVSLARGAEEAYAAVVREQAQATERERLARSVHDGVLQALALVSRTSTDRQLATLAAEQEVALRSLVSVPPAAVTGDADLRALVRAGHGIEVAAPATPVLLPAAVAAELAAAVVACLDNVRVHAGGRAWVLIEDERAAVTVSVRDEGPGIPPGRLDEAAATGRLGMASSVRGRLADLGGTVVVTSAPGQGTEVELRVPRLLG